MRYNLFSIIVLMLGGVFGCVPSGFAQTADDDDTYIRYNPDLQGVTSITVDQKKRYPYIRYDLNQIDMNGDNWSELREKLDLSREDTVFSIVHIGDSHIQADGNTGTTRNLFQNEYGDAGRGVIAPLRLVGTNQPQDYTITSKSSFVKSKLMSMPWSATPGVTGIALHPTSYTFSFTLKVKKPCVYLTVLASGSPNVESVTSNGREVSFGAEEVPGGVDVYLDEDCLEFTLTMSGDDVDIYGFDLRNDMPGVMYHAIGNNGAAFSSYNGIGNFTDGVSRLNPDLVILSLGTNEAFGRFSREGILASIETMVSRIKRDIPNAKILLVTPSECQKSVYSSKRSGKRKRSRRVRSYQVNTNVARIRNLIIEYGKENNIPVYDFYAVAGGEGSSAKWLNDRLLSTDRIHRTWDGYRLEGHLLYDSLINALNNNN